MRNFMREKKIYCGKKYMEVDIIPRTIWQEKTVKGKRSKKVKESETKQKNLNDKNSRRNCVQVTNANFGEGDYHISATYKPEYLPLTVKEADRIAYNYLRRIANAMKKKGLEQLKYVLITEYTVSEENEDKPVKIHHHIIINKGLSRDEVEELWHVRKKKGEKKWDRIGIVNCDRLQTDKNGLEAISKYITKRRVTKGSKKWSGSRNLIRPESRQNDYKYSKRKIERAIKENDSCFWKKEYKDYEVVEINTTYNELTGWSVYLKMWKKE